MTKKEARQKIAAVLAATLQYDLDNGSTWLYDDRSEGDDIDTPSALEREVRLQIKKFKKLSRPE